MVCTFYRYVISIHAPREGGDYSALALARMVFNFNPRPPRGGRRQFLTMTMAFKIFQSTPPARGATRRCGVTVDIAQISIHAPREGGD